MFRYNRGDFDQFYSIKFWWPVVFRYSRFWCPIIFRYTRRDPSSCSRLKSTTGTALSSGAIKVKLVCLGQFQHLNSTYLYFSFGFHGKAKRTQQGNLLQYFLRWSTRTRKLTQSQSKSSTMTPGRASHILSIYYPYILHILSQFKLSTMTRG